MVKPTYIIIKILIKPNDLFQMSNKHVDELTLTTDFERVNQFNIIGCALISYLNRSKHIDEIANRCSRTIGLINKSEHFIQIRIKLHSIMQ